MLPTGKTTLMSSLGGSIDILCQIQETRVTPSHSEGAQGAFWAFLTAAASAP